MTEENIKEVLSRMDPGLRSSLLNLREAVIKKSYLEKEIEEVKKSIIEKPERPKQLIFSFLPHQLAKTSIFFPLSDRELKVENRKISRLEHNTDWGKIVIEGIKLAIFEEDILLALLYLAKNQTIKDERGQYVLKTKMTYVAKVLYGSKGYTRSVYERIDKTLGHFGLVRFDIVVGTWEKRRKETLDIEKKISIDGILSGRTYDPKTQDLTIDWNARFFAYFLESMLTNINLTLRRALKKDGSKALLRFLSTHRNPGRMHMKTVLDAINYNTNQPLHRLRTHLKSFIAELKKHNVLGPKSRIFKDDTVFFDIQKYTKKLPD